MIRRAGIVVAFVALVASTADAQPTVDPYRAGLAYAGCMRAHGVPHPDPDRKGDFRLTRAQEQRLHAVGRAKVQAADKACFRYLKPVVSTQPLSPKAMRQAARVLGQVRACVHELGFELGAPVVRNMSRGRAFFGFQPGPRVSEALTRAEHTCERRVRLAQKLDAIIAVDRAPI